ncbi:MAG: amidase [Proteobacteria bacterium]|nr:amidase [Pseudomonadota bacterium]
MNFSEYADLDGLGIAALLQRGEVTPRQLGRMIVDATVALNPQLNAVVELYDDVIDGLGDRPDVGLFGGLPTLTKDFPIEAGRPAEFGSVFTKGFKASSDDSLWEKLRAGGLINIGRTTTSEFGIAAATESSLYGATCNPWDIARGVAGSSGGSAAAVAAGIVPFAQGADGGGSIRTPSSFCGVVGLKPSRGRVSGAPDCNAPLLGLAISFMLTRSIRDTAALLDLAEGACPGDGYEIVRPETSYTDAIKRPAENCRIALCTTSWSGYPIDAEVVAGANGIAKGLEDLGHRVEIASPIFDYGAFLQAQKVIWGASTAQSLDQLSQALGRPIDDRSLQQTTLAVYRYGKSLDAASLISALGVYDQVTRQVGEFLAGYDVLLTPTCPTLPEKIGLHAPDRPGRDIDTVFGDLAPKETFSALFNGTGSPAISLPLAWSANDLPIGIQFIAPFGREDTLLRLGALLEAEFGWRHRIPPVHVTKIT